MLRIVGSKRTSFSNMNVRNIRMLSAPSSLFGAISDPLRFNRIAVVDPDGSKYSYGDICHASNLLANKIKSNCKFNENVECIASYNPPGVNYVITALACWQLGVCVVPLSVSHSIKELDYFISDSESQLVVGPPSLTSQLNDAINVPNIDITTGDIWLDWSISNNSEGLISMGPQSCHLTDPNSPDDAAMIIYTSGTTGQPKGVVHTHNSILHMITTLVQCWEIKSTDKILHFLPLHHVHGIVNKLWCLLFTGGQVEFLKSAKAMDIWRRLALDAAGNNSETPSIFMAVPTVYAKMLEVADKLSDKEKADALACVREMRLMVSGSAALPDPVMLAWQELTGHLLLERYGMTEIGMALSNPYFGLRRPGYVGYALPWVQCRVVKEAEGDVEEVVAVNGEAGELRIKGPMVFQEYFRRPNDTKATFDREGWFRTGDIVVAEEAQCADESAVRLIHWPQPGQLVYRILGRNSTDIIKSAGYKLSALEIERELISHPEVVEAAVIGKDDNTYGQIVCAIVALKAGSDASSCQYAVRESISVFLKARLAVYKHPRVVHIVSEIPRNHMGKVSKKTLLKDLNL